MRTETLWSKEAATGDKAGEVGLDDEGVAAAEVGMERDMLNEQQRVRVPLWAVWELQLAEQ